MAVEFGLRRLESSEKRPPFDCGDDDLNEFFSVDSILSGKELISVTYVAETTADGEAVAFFSVSNDAIKKEDLTGSSRRRVLKDVPRPKQYKSMPAVKIGRLAVCKHMQGQRIGPELLDFMKMWFTQGNKTGCRFILVDAYNNPRAVKFYKNSDFEFLTQEDEDEDTRMMYFDLTRFRL